MIIFLFIAISYIRPVLNDQEKIKEIIVTWQESEKNLYDDLHKEFKDNLEEWGAEIDRETLVIRFDSPKILFPEGVSKIPEPFKDILKDFFPRYMVVLDKYAKNIDEIRIEGHTSSKWKKDSSVEGAYYENMRLSQARTRKVLDFCLSQASVNDDVKAMASWARTTYNSKWTFHQVN